MKRTLLDDVEKIYFAIPCKSGVSCEYCGNKLIRNLSQNLLKSLKKYYCNKDFNCNICDKIEKCEINQKIY